jgi:hypothetical protein
MLGEDLQQIPWEGHPKIGWWGDKDTLRVYHGTHKNNIKHIAKDGISKPDPDTGLISVAMEPNTAHGYASMSGGESSFRKSGHEAVHVPDEHRRVVVADIPKDWAHENMDHDLSGNIGQAKKHLSNKVHYDNWKNHDTEYYALGELRFKKPIPKEFIKGVMSKK